MSTSSQRAEVRNESSSGQSACQGSLHVYVAFHCVQALVVSESREISF